MLICCDHDGGFIIGGSFRPTINLATLELRFQEGKRMKTQRRHKRRRFVTKYASFFFFSLSELCSSSCSIPSTKPSALDCQYASVSGINFDNTKRGKDEDNLATTGWRWVLELKRPTSGTRGWKNLIHYARRLSFIRERRRMFAHRF